MATKSLKWPISVKGSRKEGAGTERSVKAARRRAFQRVEAQGKGLVFFFSGRAPSDRTQPSLNRHSSSAPVAFLMFNKSHKRALCTSSSVEWLCDFRPVKARLLLLLKGVHGLTFLPTPHHHRHPR